MSGQLNLNNDSVDQIEVKSSVKSTYLGYILPTLIFLFLLLTLISEKLLGLTE